ncbi:unnamed protein product [Polarella glacialis]|uniref:Uncharacterized protein n=1 Tax=Polarella glacialis TaxID=89957 RepID=A0A813DDJ4_POLGL|nr:unnamed protein product [Polarella glacialis]
MSKAVASLCSSSRAKLLEVWLGPGFEDNYARYYDSGGWTDSAFVNYFAVTGDHPEFANTTEELIKSVHTFSSKPIVVVNFGHISPVIVSWTAKRFPQLVLLNAHRLDAPISFNFNKFRAMMLANVRTGVQLDSDQFVYRGADVLFDSTEREVTKDYPYPILPVHWLARDPEGKDGYEGYEGYDAFRCQTEAGDVKCPKRTMR